MKMTPNNTAARKILTIKKINAILRLIQKVMTNEAINIIGARAQVRITIIKAICTLVTSVVIRVINEPVE